MPPLGGIYAEPGAALGGALGGTLGASAGAGTGFLGQLLSLLEPLDYARQAAWNVPDKLSQGDWLGALPGLGGLAAGALAAPFIGAPAIGVGALAAMLGQSVGKMTGSESFQARNPTEFVAQMTGMDPESFGAHAGGFLASALTDPLSYVGVGAGGSMGARAGRRAGGALEEAAWARGPGYGASTAPIDAMEALINQGIHSGDDLRRLQAMRESPDLARVLGEIPPGSTPMGSGAEAFVWKTPEGDVVRVAGGPGSIDGQRTMRGDRFFRVPPREGREALTPYPAAQAPEIIQPAREAFHGDFSVQRNPFVPTMFPESPLNQERNAFGDAIYSLQQRLSDRGLDFRDAHEGNLGRMANGNWLVTDPGAVLDLAAQPGKQTAQPGRMTSTLLDLLGSNGHVRNEISNRLMRSQGVSLPNADDILMHGPLAGKVPTSPLLDELTPILRRRQ